MLEPALLIIFAIFIPVVAAALINLLPFLREAISVTAGTAILCIIYYLGNISATGDVITAKVLDLLPGLPILFKLEPLGLVYAGLLASLWIVTAIYSSGYLRLTNDQKQPRFFIYLSLSIAAALGIAFSGNLLTMLVFYEILTLVTYPLVAHKGDHESVSAGRKYLIYLLGTSLLFLLPAIIITYSVSGTLEFTQGGVFTTEISAPLTITLMILFIYGIGKAALMPLHGWLPAAMVAPTPVSALLHAVAVVKAGVFCIIKILVYTFGIDMLKFSHAPNIIPYIATFTIITASVYAIFQDSLKKRLAYSTIAQLSYIILAASILTKAGIIAAGIHMVSHAVAKITLFFAAGAIIIVSGKKYVSELNGLGRKMPFVFSCFLIASLSLIGVPFLAGGESKHLISSAAESGDMQWITYLLYAGIILNCAYLLPVSYRAFLKKTDETPSYKTPLTIKFALLASTILIITFGIYGQAILKTLGNI